MWKVRFGELWRDIFLGAERQIGMDRGGKTMAFEIKNGVLVKYNGEDAHVVIPDGVTAIGKRAFRGCTSLTQVTIPSSVTSIGWVAFEGCKSLTQVTIPSSVTEIGWGAFELCTSLTQVDIQPGVKIGRASCRERV